MRKQWKTMILFAAVLTMLVVVLPPVKAYALNIMPVSMELYTTSGTPVYAAPDVYAQVVTYLDRFINVRVTGITDNGFYQVNLGDTYYIPGPYMITQVEPVKTEKQKALENLDKLTEAYRILLEQMESYSPSFALVDVTGDGIPEVFDKDGKEIYTYYNERPVMIYYSENPVSFQYSKKDNKLLGKYEWNKNTIWEVYYNDTSLLPWGQLRCYTTAASEYQKNATAVSRDYTNDEATRADLNNILKKILSL